MTTKLGIAAMCRSMREYLDWIDVTEAAGLTHAGTRWDTGGALVVVELAVMSVVALALLAALGERVQIRAASETENSAET